ncbi:3-phosphoshikimate 1-carboxyvinyltransferase [bacterium]|nr:3-phosphoshikimate 1-carboxyvinyltransferase [bacterium]
MQRAVACAALAEGTSALRSGELCADSRSALRLAETLGARVEIGGDAIRIRGIGGAGRSSASDEPLDLDCGESGLCMRMFSPIAALSGREARLLGSGSLRLRPMGMVEGPLTALGAFCRTTEGHQPIAVRGPLRGGDAEIDAGESSQLLTGLLIALPLAERSSTLRVARAVSRGYLDLTIDTCAAFGVAIARNGDYSRFDMEGGQRYRAADFSVEGDWSGAAFLVAAAAIAAVGELEIRGLRADSSQPDRAILAAAEAAGASPRWEGARLLVGRARGLPFAFDATDCPDLFPPLAALAARCDGTSSIRGVHRLRGKESDRAASLKAAFDELGCPVSFDGDVMLIRGGAAKGGKVDAAGDHRIAMAAAVAALGASGDVEIVGSECVAKSWPAFFEDLDDVALT